MPIYNNDILTGVPEGYELVWADEFDGDSVNRKNWCFKPHMCGQKDLNLYDDERAVKVKDGCVNLFSNRDGEGMFSTNYSLSTAETMVFKYGYLEICAKVPMNRPAFPSFWMQSSQHKATAPDVLGEIDIFEYFSTPETYIQTGIHKWYREDPKDHFLCPHIGRAHFESNLIGNSWHRYALLWTPETLKFLVDGQVYHTIDITEASNFGEREGTNMNCFHDFYYIIFNNYLNTPHFARNKPEVAVKEDDIFPINYQIDYVRLYQKPGEGSVEILSK